MNLYKKIQETEHTLYILNPFSKGKNIYNLITTFKQINISDFFFFLKKKNYLFLILFLFWKLIKDKNLSYSHRIKLILFFFSRPKEFLIIFDNIRRIYPFLKNIDFNIMVSAHSGWIFPLSYVLSRILNKKLVTMAHGNDFLIRSPLTLKTYFFRNVDKIIVSNNLMKKYIMRTHQLHDNQIEVINRGINLEESKVVESKEQLRKEFNIPKDAFVILSVGRHNSRKKFDLVIKAISKIKKLKPSISLRYYLIGEGKETANLKNITTELGLEKEVKFLGSCDNKLRNKFYKLSDLFIMPSITRGVDIEGFGIVFLEANYYKLPVIGTSTGGITEAIIDGETGLLIEPNNLNSLNDKIIKLLENKDLRDIMGEKGYRRVIKDFSWDELVYQYIKVFSDVLGY
ncbi:MAG: glycosyltransferase family 4 protein [Promethearchaeota archaeon]